MDESTWNQVAVGAVGTLARSGGRIALAIGHQAFALDADRTIASIEAGSLRLDSERGIRLRLTPVSGQNAQDALAQLGLGGDVRVGA